MKKLIAIAALTVLSTFAAFAQNGKDEQEILKLNSEYEQAGLKNDAAFFERVWADDYIYSGADGKTENRTQALEFVRKEKEKPTFKLISLKSDDVKIRLIGNAAVVTANWTSETTPIGTENVEVHFDKGRYTMVYEKRNGKWTAVSEHISEAPHDRKLMEQQVLKMGQEYGKMIKNQDAAAVERILADEYLFTNEVGKVKNKAEDLATYKTSDTKFEMFEVSDQKVRVIGNGAAIETGSVRFKGSQKGKPFDGSERYTTTWVWRGGRWQVAADHVSDIK
ncbi:MAG: nuclear transport factor 2 family protein [Acidobacteriota bacterium]|nr:nuclear transport factor 2 family protein [Acidobacteriota bacterium]